MLELNLRAYPYDPINVTIFDTTDQVKKTKQTTSSATEVKEIWKGKWWGGGNIIDDIEIIRDDYYLFLQKIKQLTKDFIFPKMLFKRIKFLSVAISINNSPTTTTNER